MAQSAHNPPEANAPSAESAQVDIDSILAEVQGLRAVVDSAIPEPSPVPETPAAAGELDFSALERDIEALLSGNGSGAAAIAPRAAEPASSPQPPTAPSAPPPTAASIQADAFREPPTDPLIAEIERTLADDSDSLIASAGGVAAALDGVFDQKAFASQEDDIQRALIDARGSSRVPQPTFSTPITHPAPKFDGTSRGTTGTSVPVAAAPQQPKPAIANVVAAKVELSAAPAPAPAPAVATTPNPDFAGETPFEAAFPSVPPTKTETLATRVQETAAAAGVQPSVQHEPTVTPVEPEADTVAAAPSGPRFLARFAGGVAAATGRALRLVANAPAVVLAVPMRFVPDNARAIVGIAAITMVLWVPVAWWMALSNTRAQGVGPVELVVREAPAAAESHAGSGGEAKAGAADHGASAEPAKAAH
ncbi:MAG: hypothetical protein ACKO0W_03255 [Planctomycetota bacterium]